MRILERVDGPGDKDGQDVGEMDWEDVPRFALVDLENGHFAYGYQLERIDDDLKLET